ncbi:MAG: biotin--[acetyl-CoA-carboxylase] ligase [Gemmatimonadaceae bacterium]|nr:biotin--[acetyl-CoA-carboxylase] ligase [Gemmatimonadaceae bacterium]
MLERPIDRGHGVPHRPAFDAWRWHPSEACAALARRLNLPRVAWLAEATSTMDVAEQLAREGAAGGTLVLADAQTAGRGRGGRAWASPPATGLWMTLIERPLVATGLDVLSLRVGLRAASALDRFADAPIALKWPNDLLLPAGKLGGILVEARWREHRPEWVAMGIGINLLKPPVAGSAALGVLPGVPSAATPGAASGDAASGEAASGEGASGDASGNAARYATLRDAVLGELVPAVRAAAAADGPLTDEEMEAFARRDWARGRRVTSPHAGTVAGLSATGAVLIETSGGIVACRSGSLVLEGGSA